MPRNALYIGSIRPWVLQNFSGGWNPRDAPSEVAQNESPDCLNVTLDERGGVVGRLGQTRLGSGSTLSGSPSIIFYSRALGVTFVQDGAALRKTTDFASFTTVNTFTTTERCAMVDFNNKLVVVHPTDKVATYDGTTWTAVATSPKGSCIAAWQNKVWVSGDPSAIARVYACNQGDPATWTLASDFNDIRENDGTAVVALGAGPGQDISGRPGLLVFKNNSVHRINVSTSGTTFGQYTTLTTKTGAAGPMAVCAASNGVIGFVGERGIWITDGVNAPSPVSRNLEPLFQPNQLNFSKKDLWCAGSYKDRLVFSMTRGNSQTTNNFTLEYSPLVGWVVPHSFGCSSFTEFQLSDRKLYGASPTAGKVFDVFTGGTDDGTPITARYQTVWSTPFAMYRNRYRKIRVEGRGSFDLYAKLDYDQGQGQLIEFVAGTTGFTWGVGTWGASVWGNQLYEDTKDFYGLGVGHAIGFELNQTYSSSSFAPNLLEDGAAAEVGPFALYGIQLDYIRLGYT